MESWVGMKTLFIARRGLAAGRWFYPGTLIFSTNKTESHDITEILLKLALITIKPKTLIYCSC